MSEFLMGEPIPEGIDRLSWHTTEREIRSLLPEVSANGLAGLRSRLRSDEWKGAPEDVQARRRLLLSDVCMWLGSLDGAADYYRSVGDVIPSAPVDASSLEGDTPKS